MSTQYRQEMRAWGLSMKCNTQQLFKMIIRKYCSVTKITLDLFVSGIYTNIPAVTLEHIRVNDN